MSFVLMATLAMAGGRLGADAVALSARIEEDSLHVGEAYGIQLRYTLSRDLADSKSGVPNAILQIDVPPSVRLAGSVLKSLRELSRNEFLHAPFERLLKKQDSVIEFTLHRKPAPGEAFSLNFVGYVSTPDGEHHFVRRRIELPLSPNAESRAVAPTPTDWGEVDFLSVGDRAVSFDLPTADGGRVALSEYLGKTNVIVTTYRAFW